VTAVTTATEIAHTYDSGMRETAEVVELPIQREFIIMAHLALSSLQSHDAPGYQVFDSEYLGDLAASQAV
jgi:hypothetical protein